MLNHPLPRRYRLMLGLLILTAVSPARPADAASTDERLADEFARQARLTINEDPITTRSVDAAVTLIREAVELDPDTPRHWRLALEIAQFAEREQLESRAVRALAELSPDDDVIRLMRINLELDGLSTVDERLERYDALLREDRRAELGSAVTSRLLLDRAILLRRQGETDRFADSLAEAVAVDPANTPAVALATGYFQSRVDNPYDEAELLTTLVLADPTDWQAQLALADVLLRNGAYHGATRLYEMAYDNRVAARGTVNTALLADYAIAQWATGRADAARRTVREYQRAVNELYQMQVRRNQPDLSLTEVGRMTAPIDPVVATVRAAIENRTGDGQAAENAFARAVQAYHNAITQRLRDAEQQNAEEQQNQQNNETDADGEQQNPQQREAQRQAARNAADRMRYELAWVAAWLGPDADTARDAFTSADEHRPFNDKARQRFEGWFAIRAGDYDRAVELLEPLADEQITARLGMAVASLELGRRRTAARAFLNVIREQPGTLMGIWAADHLAELLGERVPVSDLARDLESLIEDIPRVVDRYPTEPNLAVTLRVTPDQNTFEPFEPPIVNVSITNNTPYPLAIDPEGPIRPQVALYIHVRTTAAPNADELEPMIVDIGRRLRLEPRQTLTVPVDLRHSALGSLLRNAPLSGTGVTVRAVSNFRVNQRGIIEPYLLGSESRSNSFRINGRRVDEQWIRESLADLADPDQADVETTAMLSHFVARVMSGEPGEREQEMAGDVVESILDAYAAAPPRAQAWLLANCPIMSPLEPMRESARQSDHRHVQLIYLVTQIRDPDDPMIDAGRRSDDQAVNTIADFIAERTQIRLQQQERRRRQRQEQSR